MTWKLSTPVSWLLLELKELQTDLIHQNVHVVMYFQVLRAKVTLLKGMKTVAIFQTKISSMNFRLVLVDSNRKTTDQFYSIFFQCIFNFMLKDEKWFLKTRMCSVLR